MRPSTILIILGFVLATAETAYFGWNPYPYSLLEALCDVAVITLSLSGLILYLVKEKYDAED